jgi:3-isopropylmalate/(R)-2-methylmalate dehydratase small subunit
MEPIRRFASSLVAIPADDIDTDQIIPARFLKTTDRRGLGEALFADWRRDAHGEPRPDFPLERPERRGARILVAGRNFGCGSSREHAAWALLGYGFRAVTSTDFADIFRANAVANGLLPIRVSAAAHAELLHVARDPDALVLVDLPRQSLAFPDGAVESFPIDAFEKHCLMHGTDRLGFLLRLESRIASFEAGHPAAPSTFGLADA